MSDRSQHSTPDSADAAQRPHVPGQDPRGSGLPRQRDAVAPPPDPSPTAAESESPQPDQASAQPDQGSPLPGEEDAPLGGSEVTEEQLQADTAVEQDALKSLDPDDTPA